MFRMNDINFPSPENQWNANVSTASATPYMQPTYTEYLGLNISQNLNTFKIEAGSNLATQQVCVGVKLWV